MKHTVIESELKGSDISPPALLKQFREISIAESRRYFRDPSRLVEVDCPACSSGTSGAAFDRDGFTYQECADCGSLFVSPRPDAAALTDYYRESKAARFRADFFGRLTAPARVDLILESRARWIARLWDEVGPRGAYGYVDIGTTYAGLLDQLRILNTFRFTSAYDPAPGAALDGVVLATEPPQHVGAVGLFEQLEHRFDPFATLAAARDLLVPGGLLFLTTRAGSGFDIKTLGGKADYLFVPEHLNLISVEGGDRLMERLGMEAVELSTPGQLDVELVRSTLPDLSSLPPFLRYMFEHRGEDTLQDFQQFLQKNRLSSHLRIAATRKEAT